MFDTLLAASGFRRGGVRKALTLTLSLLFHAAAIAAVIVVPLLRAEAELPGFAVIDVGLTSPPIVPGVPPSGRPPKGGPFAGPHGGGHPTPPPLSSPTTLRAPEKVPTDIWDEDPTDLVTEGPDGPGVPDSPGDGSGGSWIISKDIFPEEVKPLESAITTIRPPRLIKRVNPGYSPAALAARISGPVVIEAVTDIYGRVREARVVSGHALLSMSALEAVREWIYEPYLINGIPRPVIFTVTVTFTLEKR